MTPPPTSQTPMFTTGTGSMRWSRGCPHCFGPTARIARLLPDRVLSLWMPVKRYRCCDLNCNWEGLLLARRPRQLANDEPKSTLSDATDLMAEAEPVKQGGVMRLRSSRS